MIIAKDRATSHIGAVRLERGDLLATSTSRRTTLPALQASSHPRKHFVATARAGAAPTAAPGVNHAFPTSQTLSWLPTRSTRFSTARREFTTRDMRIRGGNNTRFKKNGEGFQRIRIKIEKMILKRLKTIKDRNYCCCGLLCLQFSRRRSTVHMQLDPLRKSDIFTLNPCG